MTRKLLTVIMIAGVLVATAARADAHEEIAPTTISVGKPAFLTISAANETESQLVELTMTAPAGATLGDGTREPSGWKATTTPQKVTWTGGQIAPNHFEQWGIELEAPDQPGELTFSFTLRYADGKTDDSKVPVTVVAAASAPQPSSVSPTTITPTTSPVVTASTKQDDSRANVALIFAIGGTVVAIAALVIVLQKRSRAAGRTSGAEQQW